MDNIEHGQSVVKKFTWWDWTVLVALFILLPPTLLSIVESPNIEQTLARVALSGIIIYGIWKYITKKKASKIS